MKLKRWNDTPCCKPVVTGAPLSKLINPSQVQPTHPKPQGTHTGLFFLLVFLGYFWPSCGVSAKLIKNQEVKLQFVPSELNFLHETTGSKHNRSSISMIFWLQPLWGCETSLVLIFTMRRCKQNKQVWKKTDLEHTHEKCTKVNLLQGWGVLGEFLCGFFRGLNRIFLPFCRGHLLPNY